MEGPSLFGGPNEYEGFCMWRAYPSPPLSATRMRISASCLYIARCYFGNQLVLQSSDLEGSYNTDPGHGYSGSWFVFSSVCLFSKPALETQLCLCPAPSRPCSRCMPPAVSPGVGIFAGYVAHALRFPCCIFLGPASRSRFPLAHGVLPDQDSCAHAPERALGCACAGPACAYRAS